MEDFQGLLYELEDKINRTEKMPVAYQNHMLDDIRKLCFGIISIGNLQSISNISNQDIQLSPLQSGKTLLKIAKEYAFKGASLKPTKVFISHASKDLTAINALVSMLEDLGCNKNTLFCSSVASYGIPLGEDIYDYLKRQFQDYNLHVIYLLSKNYYDSVACLNEMGAAWVLSYSQTAFLLPDFEYSEIRGAINPNKIGIKFKTNYDDNELYNLKDRINEFKSRMMSLLDDDKEIGQWEKRRDQFIKSMSEL